LNEGTAKVNLKLIVLWELSDEPLSGYDIIKRLEAQGRKAPSPGSLYPILHDLHNNSLVSVTEEGKKKIYFLTKEGKAFLRKMNTIHSRSVSRMMAELGKIAKEDELGYYERLNSLSDKYKKEMISDMDVLGPLQDAIIDVYKKKNGTARKHMRKIIKDATMMIQSKVKK
jgi:DNA-binding PadR family transcriptional regulator